MKNKASSNTSKEELKDWKRILIEYPHDSIEKQKYEKLIQRIESETKKN